MIYLIGYILTIFGANWALQTFGLVPVAPGLMGPAGVYFAGLALLLRDGVQERMGKAWTVGAILVGAGLSAFVSPQFAVASGAAFLLSEMADFAVYTPLRSRSWLLAVVLSNTVGDIVDTCIFLWLAFGSLAYIEGQLIGKWWVTAVFLVGMYAYRALRMRTRRGDLPVGNK